MDAAVSSDQDAPKNGYGMYTTQFRALDVRLGRWFSPDPITQPWQSPYCSMDNNPIAFVDPLGLIAEGEGGGSVGSDAPGQGGSTTGAGGGFDYSNPGDLGNTGGGSTITGGANPASINAAITAISNPINVAGEANSINWPVPTAKQREASRVVNAIIAKRSAQAKAKALTNFILDGNEWWNIVLQSEETMQSMWHALKGSNLGSPIPKKTTGRTIIAPVLSKSQWVSQHSPTIQCLKAGQAMVKAGKGPAGSSQTIDGYLMSNDDGTVLKDAGKAIDRIDAVLNSRKPVLLGVSYKPGYTGNNDDVTDHWIVIVGKGATASGMEYYLYFDPKHLNNSAGKLKGTSAGNRLYLKGNKLTAKTTMRGEAVIYTASWLRAGK